MSIPILKIDIYFLYHKICTMNGHRKDFDHVVYGETPSRVRCHYHCHCYHNSSNSVHNYDAKYKIVPLIKKKAT